MTCLALFIDDYHAFVAVPFHLHICHFCSVVGRMFFIFIYFFSHFPPLSCFALSFSGSLFPTPTLSIPPSHSPLTYSSPLSFPPSSLSLAHLTFSFLPSPPPPSPLFLSPTLPLSIPVSPLPPPPMSLFS